MLSCRGNRRFKNWEQTGNIKACVIRAALRNANQVWWSRLMMFLETPVKGDLSQHQKKLEGWKCLELCFGGVATRHTCTQSSHPAPPISLVFTHLLCRVIASNSVVLRSFRVSPEENRSNSLLLWSPMWTCFFPVGLQCASLCSSPFVASTSSLLPCAPSLGLTPGVPGLLFFF